MPHQLPRTLPEPLQRAQREIEEYARAYGLDFFDVAFELLDRHDLNAVAALGGFPTRYPHWRFGMEYERLSTSYTYGLAKIYELVINNDPCYAYLMDSNSLTDQKLVMAHVYGHCDFFKNNLWFAHTNRRMVDEMANHGRRVRSFMDRYGTREVEDFIDVCLSVEDLIDPYAPHAAAHLRPRAASEPDDDDHTTTVRPTRFSSKEYLDQWMNPPVVLADEARRLSEEAAQRRGRFPQEPERDVLAFVMEHGRLRPWQRDVLGMIRDESYYFAPQGQTKIMNEGWASYWHSTIMTQRGLTDAEVVDFADHHSGTMAMPQGTFNPYKVGLELFRDIEDRWNRGRFGKEFDECDDLDRRRSWDLELGHGREKVFEVRRIHNDVTFVETFLTEEFCRQHRLFAYGFDRRRGEYVVESRDFERVKERLLFQLTNLGRPTVEVVDGNFGNRGELCLRHRYMGVELKLDWAEDVLVNLWRLWGRPVHVETVVDDGPVVLGFDGAEHSREPRAAGAG